MLHHIWLILHHVLCDQFLFTRHLEIFLGYQLLFFQMAAAKILLILVAVIVIIANFCIVKKMLQPPSQSGVENKE